MGSHFKNIVSFTSDKIIKPSSNMITNTYKDVKQKTKEVISDIMDAKPDKNTCPVRSERINVLP